MPGGRSPKPKPAVAAMHALLWAQDPSGDFTTVAGWEPRGEEFTNALLEILATGAAIMIRPGSGGRAIGIAIWEGDVRHPATWCYDDEEVNLWAAGILKRAGRIGTSEKES